MQRTVPRPVIETTEWVVDGPAVLCAGRGGCGHEHYVRRLIGVGFVQRTWKFCEVCDCDTLRSLAGAT